MKIIWFLTFGFILVFSAAATDLNSDPKSSLVRFPQDKIFNEIKNVVEKGVDFVKETIEKISLELRTIQANTKENIFLIIQESLQKVVSFIKKIKDQAVICVIAKVCVAQHSEKFEEIKNQTNVDIEKCKRAAKNDAIEIEQEIWQSYMLVVMHIREMYDAIEECVFENQNSTIKQKLCVIKKINFFKDQVREAVEIVNDSIGRLEKIIPKVLKDFAKCISNAEIIKLQQLAEIMHNVKKCIEINK